MGSSYISRNKGHGSVFGGFSSGLELSDFDEFQMLMQFQASTHSVINLALSLR